MKGFLTILIIFSVLLQVQGQVKKPKVDNVSPRIIKTVDSTATKINRANNKIETRVQTIQQKLDHKLIGATKTAPDVDSTELKNKIATDRIKTQASLAEHKFDSINQKLKERDQFQIELPDSIKNKINGTVNRVKTKSQGIEHKIDSVDQKIKASIHNKLSGVDSVNQRINQTEARIQQKQKQYTDSLNALTQKYEQKLQIKKLTGVIDSLKGVTQPYDKYVSKLDSINNLNPLQKTQGKITQAQSKIQNLTDKPKTSIDEKLNLLSKESGGRGNVPAAVNIPNADLKGVTGKISSDVKLPDTNLTIDNKLPGLNQPSVNNPSLPVNKDLNTKLDLPKDIANTKDLNKLNDLKKGSADISQVSGKVTGYTNDVKNIEKGDLEKVKTLKEDAVSKLPVNNELTEIQKQDKLAKEQAEKLQSFKHPEEYKKQTLARSNEMIAKQLAVYEKQIQESVSKVSKYQSKAGTILGHTNDLPKQRDMLKKLKMYEKFVPGLTLQIQKPSAWLVDINPSLRYRLTSYWSVGLGWNDRVLFGCYKKNYDQVRIFGPRSFTEVVIFKGLSFRLDAEDMNVLITPDPQMQDTGKRLWIWSYMAGIKKEFSFVPHVIGNAQFMYNVYSSYKNNPYVSAFNVRFGFEPILKKRIKK